MPLDYAVGQTHVPQGGVARGRVNRRPVDYGGRSPCRISTRRFGVLDQRLTVTVSADD